MYNIYPTNQFKKDLKQAKKQGKNISELLFVINCLAAGESLAPKYKDHLLTGNWKNHRECHINPDWLLIYKVENEKLILTLSRTGSHSEIL